MVVQESTVPVTLSLATRIWVEEQGCLKYPSLIVNHSLPDDGFVMVTEQDTMSLWQHAFDDSRSL